MADEILFSLKDGVATITMNRPEKRNALNTVLLEGFHRILAHVEESQEARVVVIRGEGKAFCSGIDLRELSSRQTGQGDPEVSVVQIFQRIERSRIPTIAMVHGDALAGGCELALHCDLRVAAEPARFGMPLARLGLIVPFPLGQKLVEIIGPAFTKQILLTGQPIDAKRAYEIGMVHQLVTASELENTTYELARTIADNAPLSIAGMKATIQRAISLRETIDHKDLDEMVNRARKSADAQEGVKAMLEKRKPVFRGE
ncbi:MAG TPA: enoyl-CoA hydratase/isomerase family protein [Methylomirabilota bacterium]|jgi:enoyl-CoA hydratase/carnithine racemase|nr:enoyl-CoA hydratase/isomerase family protein [Methylomirabilota bacterium]